MAKENTQDNHKLRGGTHSSPVLGERGGHVAHVYGSERLEQSSQRLLSTGAGGKDFGPHQERNWENNMNTGVHVAMNTDSSANSAVPSNSNPVMSKSRMRVSKACVRCRSQKIKCSGTFPCTTCINHSKDCFYASAANSSNNTDSKREVLNKKDLITEDKSVNGYYLSPSNDNSVYIRFLENRIHLLENKLKDSGNGGFESHDDDIHIARYKAGSGTTKWRHGTRLVGKMANELCSSVYDRLSNKSKNLVTVPRTQFFGWNMSGTHYISEGRLPQVPRVDVELDQAILINYFFEYINPLFAILHEAVFRKQLELYNEISIQIESEQNSTFCETKANETKLFSAMLKLILALSIRFKEMQSDNPSLELLKVEEKYFEYGHEVVSILSFHCQSFELIQAWLLEALYLRCTHRQTSYCSAMGSATTMVKSMGLGVSSGVTEFAPKHEKLKAKRIFWSVYCFDVLFSAHYGRSPLLGGSYMSIKFPSLDFKEEARDDDWITLPSLALIHIAKIADFHYNYNTTNRENRSVQIPQMVADLRRWLEENQFLQHDLFVNQSKAESLVRVQVNLHFFDVMYCVDASDLQRLLDRILRDKGTFDITLSQANQEIVGLLEKTRDANLLYTPWYLTLYMLFTVGIVALVMINFSYDVQGSKTILGDVLRLLSAIQDSPVRDSKGKVVVTERFKMAKECIWALKMANHIITLRLKEDLEDLHGIGIDHGPSDINKSMFTQMGRRHSRSLAAGASGTGDPPTGDTDVHSVLFGSTPGKIPPKPEADTLAWLPDAYSPSLAPDPTNALTASLEWFDRWMDMRDPL